MEYWIVENDNRVGPMSLEELVARGVSAETLVWRCGLADWTQASDVPELKLMVDGEVSGPESNGADDAETTPLEMEPAIEDSATGNKPVCDCGESKPQCPPTNLVWAVISLVCCCFPLSIVAIIYASQVRTKYDCGDYQGAQKASEMAAWWTILSIVLGLICQPFISLFQIIGSGV